MPSPEADKTSKTLAELTAEYKDPETTPDRMVEIRAELKERSFVNEEGRELSKAEAYKLVTNKTLREKLSFSPIVGERKIIPGASSADAPVDIAPTDTAPADAPVDTAPADAPVDEAPLFNASDPKQTGLSEEIRKNGLLADEQDTRPSTAKRTQAITGETLLVAAKPPNREKSAIDLKAALDKAQAHIDDMKAADNISQFIQGGSPSLSTGRGVERSGLLNIPIDLLGSTASEDPQAQASTDPFARKALRRDRTFSTKLETQSGSEDPRARASSSIEQVPSTDPFAKKAFRQDRAFSNKPEIRTASDDHSSQIKKTDSPPNQGLFSKLAAVVLSLLSWLRIISPSTPETNKLPDAQPPKNESSAQAPPPPPQASTKSDQPLDTPQGAEDQDATAAHDVVQSHIPVDIDKVFARTTTNTVAQATGAETHTPEL